MYVVTHIKQLKQHIKLSLVFCANEKIKTIYTIKINHQSNKELKKIKKLIKNYPLISHQAENDFKVLEDLYKNYDLSFRSHKIIDTKELTKILFPKIKTLQLKDLSEHFHFTEKEDRALITAELFLKLKEKLFQLPSETKKGLLNLRNYFYSDLTPLLKQALKNITSQTDNSYQTFNNLTFKNIFYKRFPKSSKTYDSFGQVLDFTFNEVLSPRKNQRELIETVYKCFRTKRHGLIEASAGIGKTLAYLLPAVYKAVKNDETILISTKTLNLQTQIIKEELPKLKSIIPYSFQWTVLKGKEHYLSLERLYKALTIEETNYHKNILKAMLLVWITETNTGDLNELNLLAEMMPYVKQLSSLYETKQSIWNEYSYYNHAYERANQSHLVIVNHALLSQLLQVKDNLILTYDKLIIDEAHSFIHAVEDGFSYVFNFKEAFRLINTLKSKTLKIKIKYQLLELYHYLLSIMNRLKQKTLTIDKVYDYQVYIAVFDMIERLHYSFTKLTKTKEKSAHINLSILDELRLIKDLFVELSKDFHHYIFTFKKIRENGQTNIFIQKNRKNIQELLNERLFIKKESVVLISATLTVNESFAYIKKQFGLNKLSHLIEKRYPSPFHLQKQTKLMVPNDLPHVHDDFFTYKITEAIVFLSKQLHGNILILFTSYKMLSNVYYLLDELIGLQYNLIAQNITSDHPYQLVDQFKQTSNSILLGTKALWEGVDIPGEIFNCLIIVQLPFDHPNDIRHEFHQKQLKQKGKNAFFNYTLPEMIIQLKQGIGRLIRTAHDKGVIFIFDDRLYTSSYRKHILTSIQPYKMINDSTASLINKAVNWLKETTDT